MSGVEFFRPSGGSKVLIHASKDGKRTLCGIEISSIWAYTSEEFFYGEKPCKECQSKLTKVMRKGKQTKLA